MKDTTAVRAPRNWPGMLALVLAVASVATFMVYMSLSGPFPKSIAYGHNLLFEAYAQSPMISLVAGALAVVVGIIALWRASSVLWTAIVSAIVGIALFIAVMVVAAQMASALAPSSLDAKAMAVASSPTIALSPPVVGMATLVIGMAAVMGMRRGIFGHRPAIAALIMGGATTLYWLFNLVWGLNAE
jgi:hypothetical protein